MAISKKLPEEIQAALDREVAPHNSEKDLWAIYEAGRDKGHHEILSQINIAFDEEEIEIIEQLKKIVYTEIDEGYLNHSIDDLVDMIFNAGKQQPKEDI